MDWLTFIAQSEWPAVTAVGLWWFRRPLSSLLAHLRPTKFKGFGVETEFDHALSKAEELTKATVPDAKALPSPKIEPPPTMAFDEMPSDHGTLTLVPMSEPKTPRRSFAYGVGPVLSVLQNYAMLQSELLQVAEKKFNKPHLMSLENAAKEIGFPPDEQAAVKELESIRNRVAHHGETKVSPVEAYRFQLVAQRLTLRARAIGDALGRGGGNPTAAPDPGNKP